MFVYLLCSEMFQFCREITVVDIVRIFALVVWVYVLYQSFSGVRAILFAPRISVTNENREDAWVAGVALSIIFFSLRWYVAVDSDTLFTGLYLFSTLIALLRITSKRAITNNTEMVEVKGGS